MTDVKSKERTAALGRHLLRVVFGLYFLIALSVTLGQLYSEYSNVNNEIRQQIKQYFNTSQLALGTAIWSFDETQIKGTIKGMLHIDAIAGIRVLDKSDSELAKVGMTRPTDSQIESIEDLEAHPGESIIHLKPGYILGEADPNKPGMDESTIRIIRAMHEFKFPVMIDTEETNGEVHTGRVDIYTHSDLAFQNVKYSFILIIINSIIKTLALWVIFLIAIRMIVEKPLNELKTVCAEFNPANPVRSGSLDSLEKIKNRDDEIGYLAVHFGRMIDSVANSMAKIKEFTVNLEELVTQRTRQLEEKNQNIETMMASMDLGVLSLNDKLEIQPQFSRKLCEILEVTEPAGRSFRDILLKRTTLSPDEQSTVASVVITSIGNDAVGFEMNRGALPKEFEFKTKTSVKLLSVDWQPMTIEDAVSTVLVVIEDVSAKRRDAKENELQSEDFRICDQILAHNAEDVHNFFPKTQKLLEEARKKLLEQGESPNQELFDSLFIALHTIKGSARVMGFTFVIDTAHAGEDLLSMIKKHPEKWQLSLVHEKLEAVNISIARYQHNLNNRILNFAEEMETARKEDTENDHATNNRAQEQQDDSVGSQSIPMMLRLIQGSMRRQAQQLAKPEPRLLLSGDGRIKKHFVEPLRNAIVHCITNSVTHGIEYEEERIENGKLPRPLISVNLEVFDEKAFIRIKDDGRGLDIAGLRKKAQEDERGIPDNDLQQLAELIFESGLSTATSLSDSAGRGIGMPAVAQLLNDIGGSVSIEVAANPGPNGTHHRFELVFQLPLAIVDRHLAPTAQLPAAG